jgi:hypothetical protein
MKDRSHDARVLLGALLHFPGALEACAEHLDPEAWHGDERTAVLGLILQRRKSRITTERILLLAEWLRERSVHPVKALPHAMRAFVAVASPAMTLEEIVALAQRVRASIGPSEKSA